MPKCNSCGKECEDFRELALHIMAGKSSHRKGKKWAATYLQRRVLNKREYDNNERTPLTEEQKQTREDLKMTLSGKTRYVNTICPKCKTTAMPSLEVEYITSPLAWRIGDRLAKICESCGE